MIAEREDGNELNERPIRKKCQLSVNEMSEILKSIRGDMLSHREAAIKFRVNTRLVSSLVAANKKNPDFLTFAHDK